MKDANNMITDEAGNKCGETGDTGHQFVECERKKYGHAFNQNTKTAAHLGTCKKKHPEIMEENININMIRILDENFIQYFSFESNQKAN